MSSNVELVKSLMPDELDLVEVINSEEPMGPFGGAPTDLVAPNIEVWFVAPDGTVPGGLTFKGVDGLLEGWRDWLLPYDSYLLSPEEYFGAGEHVVMHVRVSARTERDGVTVEHRPSSVWTVRDGRIVAVRFFLDRDEALEFAGVDQEQVSGEP
jgi:ketosteroid isomerase-like protein